MPKPRGSDEGQEGDERFLDQGDDPRTPSQGGEHEADLEGDFDEEAFDEGDVPSEDSEALEPPAPARPKPRSQLDERDVELARLRAENEAYRRTPPSPPPATQEEGDQDFERRISQLEPYEQLAARQQRSERRYNQSLAFIQASTADQLDRAAYLARAGSDPRFARYAEEVERRHQELLRGNASQPPQLVPRETILKVVLGERVLAPANREQRRQQERQQRKLDNQKVRPGSTRGDVGGGRERRGGVSDEREARRRRLENMEI